MYRVPSDFDAAAVDADVDALLDDLDTGAVPNQPLEGETQVQNVEAKECWPGADWWEYPHGNTGQVGWKTYDALSEAPA